MSWIPDITPLVNETKQFNEYQKQIINLLNQNNLLLTQILEKLTQ